MFGGILVKILGGLLIAALLGGGFLYVKSLRLENARLTQGLEAEKKVTEFFRQAAEIDKQTLKQKETEVYEIIENNAPDKSQRIYNMYYRLRQLSPAQPDKGE